MPNIRAFIALPTSADTKERMAAIQEKLIESQAEVKWETSDKFHITLKFLGDCDVDALRSLASELQSDLREVRSFELTYQTIGCFPNPFRPRVVWIGAAEDPQLSVLQRRVEEVCGRLGFPKESRAFHAHITLGRVKGTLHLDHLTEMVKTTTFDSMQVRCSEVLIMRSELRPTGSIYTLMHSIPLLP